MDARLKQVASFFALVIVLTIPFWLAGALVNVAILPGLPLAGLGVVAPAIAAIALTLRSDGVRETARLLTRAVSLKAGPRLLVVALINPLLFATAFLIARLSAPIPDPVWSVPHAFLLLAMFAPAALLEELGWSGYALDRLQAVAGPAAAAIGLGLFWAAWHYPALVEAGRSVEWIAWWTLWTVAARMIMVWVYNWTGASIAAVALYHAVSNVCWQLYPVSGSYFDPRLSALITLAAALLTLAPRRGGA